MPVEQTLEPPQPVTDTAHHKKAFFRQSGWLMMATMVSGVFAMLVHVFSKKMTDAEYSAVGTLIQVMNWLQIPALGLQMVFAQQTSAAITEHHEGQLVGTTKAVMRWTFMIWVGMALMVFIFCGKFTAALQLSGPLPLWLTVGVSLTMLWLPIFQGLLQGRQNFMWLGWVFIFNGVGRIIVAAAIVAVVILLGSLASAANIMTGFLIGTALALGTGMWHNRDLLRRKGSQFDARGWLARVVPLTMGFGASQFLFSADAIMAQKHLGGEGAAAPYMMGGTLARAIVLFTAPLAAVMFPKLVHGAARSQKHGFDLLGMTLLGTAVFGCVAAIGLTLTYPIVIPLISKKAYVDVIGPCIPWFAWSMVPLAVGNVLVNNLMAHSRFKVVPVLVAVVAGYWWALQYHNGSFLEIIKTLGVFNLIYLGVCAVFTWVVKGGTAGTAEVTATAAG